MKIFLRLLALGAALAAGPTVTARAADAAFERFLAEIRPEAEAAGVSRATFDRETRGLEPDLKLPDLALPGRPATGASKQPEFVSLPADYVKETTIAGLASAGRRLATTHADALARLEERFGVPGNVVLAIWGRETDYGRAADKLDTLRVVATQAFVGRRKEQFRKEFILALKILDEGAVKRSEFRSSWAGATGLTQFLPSEYYDHGVDLDGDGRVDIWHSVDDALGSAAKQLADKGWQPGTPWAIEVRAPASTDCTVGVPDNRRPIGAWVDAGFVPTRGRVLTATERAEPASLLQPEGARGPAFLTTKNYFVIKDYNFSDLYVLFVGHLADRIAGGERFATPWAATTRLETAGVETVQRHLARLGFYRDKIDGKAGMLTRSAVGAYQKATGAPVDCWPSESVARSLAATP